MQLRGAGRGGGAPSCSPSLSCRGAEASLQQMWWRCFASTHPIPSPWPCRARGRLWRDRATDAECTKTDPGLRSALAGRMWAWNIFTLSAPFCEEGTRFLTSKALRSALTCMVRVGRLLMGSRGTCWVCARDLSAPPQLWENSRHNTGPDCCGTLFSMPLEIGRSPKKQSELGRQPAQWRDVRVPSKAGL